MYERVFPFGADVDANGLVEPHRDIIVPIDEAGNQVPSEALAVAGIAGIVGIFALFALAIPFGVGALAGAVVAPSGRRKAAAKSGALAGGVGGLVAFPLTYGLTGSGSFAGRVSSLAPFALGGYMGWRERNREDLLID